VLGENLLLYPTGTFLVDASRRRQEQDQSWRSSISIEAGLEVFDALHIGQDRSRNSGCAVSCHAAGRRSLCCGQHKQQQCDEPAEQEDE
jgi:hypothetical protein